MEKHLGRYLQPNEFIDHKDRVVSNNQLENLRLCTLSQNQWNRLKQKNNTRSDNGKKRTLPKVSIPKMNPKAAAKR